MQRRVPVPLARPVPGLAPLPGLYLEVALPIAGPLSTPAPQLVLTTRSPTFSSFFSHDRPHSIPPVRVLTLHHIPLETPSLGSIWCGQLHLIRYVSVSSFSPWVVSRADTAHWLSFEGKLQRALSSLPRLFLTSLDLSCCDFLVLLDQLSAGPARVDSPRRRLTRFTSSFAQSRSSFQSSLYDPTKPTLPVIPVPETLTASSQSFGASLVHESHSPR
jgi:hypothetical protein